MAHQTKENRTNTPVNTPISCPTRRVMPFSTQPRIPTLKRGRSPEKPQSYMPVPEFDAKKINPEPLWN
jgi:hypothetical protein